MTFPQSVATERGFLVPFVDSTEPVYATTYQEHLDQRDDEDKRIMLSDFASVGIREATPHRIEELILQLKHMQLPYDEEYFRRIHAALAASNKDGVVTGGQFVDGYFKKKQEVRSLVDSAGRDLEAVNRLLHQSEANLKQAQHQERLGTATTESKLTVQVVSAQKFGKEVEEGTAFKVNLECQNQVIETRTQCYQDASVFWNEMFSFQIASREGDLHVTLNRVDFQEENVAECSVLVEELSDQKRHDSRKEMYGRHPGELTLSCQWIYSPKLLYQNYTREFYSKRDAKLRLLHDYQLDLDKLSKPFFTRKTKSNAMWGLLNPPELLSVSVDRAMEQMRLPNYQVASQYIVGISLVLCSIASYARPLFFDLTISGFAFWCNLDPPRRWTTSRYLVLLIATILSLALDCAWMATYFNSWIYATVESDLHNITKIFSLFNFIWKIIMLFFFWKCRHDKSKQVSLNRSAAERRRAPTP